MKLGDSNDHSSMGETDSVAPSDEAMKLLSMLKNKPPNEWIDSIDLVGPEGIFDELGVLELAIELLKSGEPLGLTLIRH